ncbi:Predicted DNA-binding transcriptional regulator YafY, contains an HTH and WYL domains [Friedmanniella luteola]|uniref:Predicted DNA-binding transcriptional regulator YafY, contains an HTH and WYL domains n=1 Tax=Friedmanniella luteola TaxID=546871 RepID=A0A1H1LJA9_9ACTN|nr:YafY family protein [Friedmanniella luteola]SDR74410.1 Predicted DNA-binding transcriptional regulator YafY, contains an HTH and WYL domains [Friedmanniella luteola]
MANTSSRTLRLLSLLQARRYWPGPVLADRLEVSPRTLRRDVERLRELGYPVDAHPGVDGGYALAPGAALPPLVVDDDEAMALAVAIQSQLAGGDGGDAALRALTKVVQVMPRRLRTRLDAVRVSTTPAAWSTGTGTAVDHTVLATLALACRDGERVRFDYRAADGAPSSRHVEPFRLVPLGRRWYLVAHDLDRHAWRTLRIDRITDARGTGVPFAVRTPPFDDVADYVRNRVQGTATGEQHHVEVVVEAPAEPVRARIGRWAEIRPRTDRTCTMVMDTDALDWPLHALGVVGAGFTVLSPPELAVLAQEWGARFVRAGAAGTGSGDG